MEYQFNDNRRLRTLYGRRKSSKIIRIDDKGKDLLMLQANIVNAFQKNFEGSMRANQEKAMKKRLEDQKKWYEKLIISSEN